MKIIYGFIVVVIMFVTFNYLFSPKLEKRELLPKNPTSYIFDVDKKTLIKAIRSTFYDTSFFYKNFNGKDVFFYPSNMNEIGNTVILIGFSSWESSIYHINGSNKSLYGSYVMTIKEVNTSKTKVSIKANNLTVAIGTSFITFTGKGGVKSVNVDGTTIEEYFFLYEIGKFLGKDMKKINRVTR